MEGKLLNHNVSTVLTKRQQNAHDIASQPICCSLGRPNACFVWSRTIRFSAHGMVVETQNLILW